MDRRAFLATLPLLLGACSPAHRITVGSKNFTEQLILGEMLAQLIQSVAHEPIDRRLYLAAPTFAIRRCWLAASISTRSTPARLWPPSSSSSRTGEHRQVFDEVKAEYLRRFNLEVFPSLGFDNSFAIVMRGDDARANEPDEAIAACAFLAQAADGSRL